METGERRKYEIILPDGEIIKIWFIGRMLEKILDAYNIKYKVKK